MFEASIEQAATDYVPFPLWRIGQDIDLGLLSWGIGFNTVRKAIATPTAASVIAGTSVHSPERSDVTVQVLVGVGGAIVLGPGVWHCYAQTTNPPQIPVFYIGTLTVNPSS